jgi:hypothetical protein
MVPAAGSQREAARRLATSYRLASSEGLLALQRRVGNGAVTAMVQRRQRGLETPHFGQPATPLLTVSREDVTTTNISETTDTGNKYTQELVLNKTNATLKVELALHWVKTGTWASDDDFEKFVRRVKTAAYSYMDNKFKVVCTPKDAAAGPAPVELPITFLFYDMDSGYEIKTHGGTPGGDSAMRASGGDIYEIQSDGTPEDAITYAHEFGHAALGVSDEYANPAVPGRILTNDHSIMANYYAQGMTQAKFKARHFQHLVTEVAKAFAGYTCTIREL